MQINRPNLNASVSKAFRLLDHFTRTKQEWGVRELAQKLGDNKSTTYRQMATLARLNILQQDPVSGKYRLGLKLFELGNRVNVQHALVTHTHPELEMVAREIAETVHLGILKNHEVLIVDKIESSKGLKLNSMVGLTTPSYCTGLGKVLLAHKNDEDLERILKDVPWTAYTRNTITKRPTLLRQLKAIKEQGYAIDREELEVGLICVAVPVWNDINLVIGAISASGPSSRFREEAIGDYVDILRRGAGRVREKIGNYNPLWYS